MLSTDAVGVQDHDGLARERADLGGAEGENVDAGVAVLAFADADMSIAAAAQRLHLHANSVTYRLERWGSLTDISARTFRGLSAAVVACRLAQNGDSPGR